MINNDIASKLVTITNAPPPACIQLACVATLDLPEVVQGGLLRVLARRASLERPISRSGEALLTVVALRGDTSPDAQLENIRAFATLVECDREREARLVLLWLGRVEALIADPVH